MNAMSDNSGRQKVMSAVAILALVLVAAGVFAGMYALARGGTFDVLLRKTPTLLVQAPTRTATSAPVATLTASPTPSVGATATLRLATATLRATSAPGSTAQPSATNTGTPEASPTASATPTESSALGTYAIEYLGCDPRGSDIGIVKGQVIDRAGKVVAGAEVRVTLDGWAYDQPAISNGAGWYEFYLQKGLKVKIISLRVAGQDMRLIGNEQVEFLAQGGCFEYVNLREQ